MKKWEYIEGTNCIYSACDNGQIRSNARTIIYSDKKCKVKDKILKMFIRKDGYLSLNFRINGKTIPKSVSRLIALTFIPNPKNLPFVCHEDDNPLNNNVDNLFWGTPKDNVDDMMVKGRYSTVQRKLNEAQVIEIKALLKKGVPHTKIASKFNVCRQVIGLINTGKTYKAIA